MKEEPVEVKEEISEFCRGNQDTEPCSYKESLLETEDVDEKREVKAHFETITLKLEGSEENLLSCHHEIFVKEEKLEIESEATPNFEITKKTSTASVMEQDANSTKNEPEQADIHKIIQCSECPYKSKRIKDLMRHISTQHSVERLFKCTKCDFATKTTDHLRSHLRFKHTPENFKWYSCEHCSYRAKSRGKLQTHIFHKHTPEDAFTWLHCPRCTYKTKIKSDLNRHGRSVHSTSRDFKCNTCGSEFNLGSNLKAHIRTKHTPDDLIKWFECDQCSNKYKYNQSLKRHIFRIHHDG